MTKQNKQDLFTQLVDLERKSPLAFHRNGQDLVLSFPGCQDYVFLKLCDDIRQHYLTTPYMTRFDRISGRTIAIFKGAYND